MLGFIKRQDKLQCLHLHDNYISASELETILNVLVARHSVQHIERLLLGHCSFDSERSIKTLVDYVNKQIHLQSLMINNQIGDRKIKLEVFPEPLGIGKINVTEASSGEIISSHLSVRKTTVTITQ